jgi:outer membrane lipoprotein SlyB
MRRQTTLQTTGRNLLSDGNAESQARQCCSPRTRSREIRARADWFETENIVLGTAGFGIGGIIGAFFGGPIGAGLGATVGAVTGTMAQEGAEEAQAAGVPRIMSYSTFGQLVGSARLLKRTIDELQNQ